MKALVLNTLGRGFDFEDVDIAPPMGREVLVNVQASGMCGVAEPIRASASVHPQRYRGRRRSPRRWRGLSGRF